MPRQAFAEPFARHRMLEGFLARLAQSPDGDAFVLRGGTLVRHWFPTREAKDVDVLCLLPFEPADLRQRLTRIMCIPLEDGIDYDTERLRFDLLHVQSPHPGIRLFAAGLVDGWWGEMSVDVTFNIGLPSPPSHQNIETASGPVPVVCCPPTMLIARKLQVTGQLGPHRWRPKDLRDIWWLLKRFEPDAHTLGEAIEHAFEGHSDQASLNQIFNPLWWSRPYAQRRWARGSGRQRTSIAGVADEIRGQLSPLLERA